MKLHRENESFPVEKKDLKNRKKLLTNESGYDKISELPLRTTAKATQLLRSKRFLIFDK